MGTSLANSLATRLGFQLGANVNQNFLKSIPVDYEYNPLLDEHNLRCVIFVDGLYYCYEEVSDGTKWNVYLRTSIDGVTWSDDYGSALIPIGAEGEYNDFGNADPTVIYDGVGDWKMWIDISQTNGQNWRVGYATSTDGINWTYYGMVIDQGGVGDWDEYSIHHPVCIKHDGVYYLYYSGAPAGYSNFVKQIGLATSTDGINWTKHASNPVIANGGVGDWDEKYVRPSNPVFFNGLWYMYYWGYNNVDGHGTGLATSKDLINWTKVGSSLISDSSANSVIKRIGTNQNDIVLKLHSVDADFAKQHNYFRINLPNSKDKLSGFKPPVLEPTSLTTHAPRIYFNRVTVPEYTTAIHIDTFLKDRSKPVTGTVTAALYSNLVNTPKNLLAVTDEKNWVDIKGDTWIYFDIVTPVEIPAGDYWLAFQSTVNWTRTRIAGGSNNQGNLLVTYGDWPNPVTATTNQAYYQDVILADYSTKCWRKILVTEPNNVYFNGVKGTKVAKPINVISEYQWTWRLGELYVYSEFLVDIDYEISYD